MTFDWLIMLAGPLQRIQFWVCLLIQSWLTLVGSNSLELANLLAAQFFKKELSLKMSAPEKVCIYLYLKLNTIPFLGALSLLTAKVKLYFAGCDSNGGGH